MRKISINIKRIALHVVFWALVYAFFVVFYGRASKDYATTIIFSSLLFPISIAATYFLNYFLIPRFLFTQRYGRFILFSFYTLVISFWLELQISVFIFTILGNFSLSKMDPTSFDAVFLFVGLYFSIIVATAIMQVRRAFSAQKTNANLDKLKYETELKLKEAELKLLKAQIHPHFLFNTLNNLYGLTLEKSDQAPKLVLQLSTILDYILYRCEEKSVSLNDELENLKNYIEIEKIRYSKQLDLLVEFPEKCDDLRIAPLILLPFVENAFKHGVSNNTGLAFVKTKLRIIDNTIVFSISNSKVPNLKNEEKHSKGIGLQNAKKRLLLLYPEKHILNIKNELDIYSVTLTLELY